MDKLKHFIEANREAFENETPPEGHLERFERKLAVRRQRRTVLYGFSAIAVAATIALLLLFRATDGTDIPEPSFACETQEEMEELRLYYNMRIHDLLVQMKALYKDKQAPGAKGLMRESERVLADCHQFERTVLPTLPCSNDALFAMTQHYDNSLESLAFMLRQMEQITKNGEENNH